MTVDRTKDCIRYLEKIRWGEKPICPYCGQKHTTPLPKESRHHCNDCNSSFSVTTNTIFHRSRIPIQKWFLAVSVVLNTRQKTPVRKLAQNIGINKDTASSVIRKIRQTMLNDREFLLRLIEDEKFQLLTGGKYE